MLLADITDTNLLQSGLFPGLPLKVVPLWMDGDNVGFREGGVERISRRGQIGSLSTGIISALASARVSGVDRLYLGTADKIYKDEGSSPSEIGSGFTGGLWSFAPWGNWLVASNGVDVPQVWKNTGSFAALSGPAFTTAEILIKRGTHLVVLNTSTGENYVEWCSSDNVELWTPATTNSAGYLQLRDIGGAIKAGVMLGDMVAVYSDDAMQLLSYLGTPFWFGTRPALNGIGAVSKNAVVSLGRFNFGMSQEGVFRTDGVSYDYIDEPAIRDWFKGQINKDAWSTVVAYHEEARQKITWFFPSGTSTRPDKGISFNYKQKAWSKLDFGMDAVLERQVHDYPILASDSDYYWQDTPSGTEPTGWIQTKPLDMKTQQGQLGPFVEKFVDAVQLDLEGTVSAYIGVGEKLNDTPTWSGPYTVSESSPTFYPRVTGAFISFKFFGSVPWSLSGILVNGDRAGDLV